MIIRTEADIQKVLALLDTQELWSTDVETSGLNCRQDKLIGFGCANPVNLQGFYIIMREFVGGQLVDVLTENQVKPVIEKLATKKLLGWNFAFDAGFILSKFDVDLMPSLHAEVMLMVHTCDENKFAYGLKQISAELFGSDTAAEQIDMKESIKANGGTATEYYKADSELMAKYGLQDNILTCRNYLHWQKELEKQGLLKFYYEDEVLPLMKEVTFYMQYKGVPVDLPLLEQTQTELADDLLKIEDEIQAAISPHLQPFNEWYINRHYPFKMSPRFKNELVNYFKPPFWPKTKSDGYSFSKADLDRAIKKGQIDPQSELYKYAMQLEKPPKQVIHDIQLKLLAQDGTKYAFNLSSKDHLKRLFFTKHGGPLAEKALSHTDKGAPQVDDEFLEAMAAKYAWASALQLYNRLTKIKGTYVDGILEKQDAGIFYPQFFQHRTVSGRFGSNLQQLPRPVEPGTEHPLIEKYNNRIRAFFVAGPGHTFVDDDYESLEPHIFAHVSTDKDLQAIFNRNHDFYSTVAIATEGLKDVSADKKAPNYLGKVNKAARQRSKAYSLGLAYGMSPYKLAFELNVKQDEAERLAKAYFSAYPDLAKWMQKSKEEACLNGRIKTLSGRIRRFPELPGLYKKYGNLLFNGLDLWKEYNESPIEYERAKAAARIAKNCVNNASNVQIQGFAASVVNKASLGIARRFKALKLTAYICASIHDEIIVRCEEKDVDTVKEIVQNEMETCVSLSVKLKAPASSGYTFLEAKGS